jgi:hypothetical protein
LTAPQYGTVKPYRDFFLDRMAVHPHHDPRQVGGTILTIYNAKTPVFR